MSVRLADDLLFPVPAEYINRYKPHIGEDLLLGLRPEHISEVRPQAYSGGVEFSAEIDVVEPMGMETVVFFTLSGHEMCARLVGEAAVAQPMRRAASKTSRKWSRCRASTT